MTTITLSKPVVLAWGKKPRGLEKNPLLKMADPETGEAVNYGKPLSAADFEGNDIYDICNYNNLLVMAAVKWDVTLDGTAYREFLEFGIRWAQQLNLPLNTSLKDRSYKRYKAAASGLEASLISGVLAERKRRRDSGLDSLLECAEGMAPEDVGKVSEYVTTLKAQPIRTREEDHLKLRLINFESDQRTDDELAKNYKLVAPQLKADYLAVVEISALNKGVQFTLHEAGSIRELLDALGAANGKLYLTAVKMGVTHSNELYMAATQEVEEAKEMLRQNCGLPDSRGLGERLNGAELNLRSLRYPGKFYNDLNELLRSKYKDENPEFFLSTLCASQEKGLWLDPTDAGIIIEDIERKEGRAAVKTVLDICYEALNRGPAAFFDSAEAHGVAKFLRELYIKAPSAKAAKA